MKNKAVLAILLIFLVATLFFWFQVSKINDLPFKEPSSGGTTKEVEGFITLVNELFTSDPDPLPSLSGLREPFIREEIIAPPVVVTPDKRFILSSIIYSDSYPLAVINGKILAEGDTIPESEFMIEDIKVDKVEITDGGDKYTLNMAPGTVKGK